ncbi:hypothetical protein CALCODRAFT_211338 [Calocera cornea HHB12733]|uniref:Uncharacterized protein n=1 Tax=Calocera cornea HHB12733 TaxID=1353952 RepID=A0A165C2Z1_9BASI|nr:hypothetical protein CALCODRAFT_211338 [Calocera cornea HHB12733]
MTSHLSLVRRGLPNAPTSGKRCTAKYRVALTWNHPARADHFVMCLHLLAKRNPLRGTSMTTCSSRPAHELGRGTAVAQGSFDVDPPIVPHTRNEGNNELYDVHQYSPASKILHPLTYDDVLLESGGDLQSTDFDDARSQFSDCTSGERRADHGWLTGLDPEGSCDIPTRRPQLDNIDYLEDHSLEHLRHPHIIDQVLPQHLPLSGQIGPSTGLQTSISKDQPSGTAARADVSEYTVESSTRKVAIRHILCLKQRCTWVAEALTKLKQVEPDLFDSDSEIGHECQRLNSDVFREAFLRPLTEPTQSHFEPLWYGLRECLTQLYACTPQRRPALDHLPTWQHLGSHVNLLSRDLGEAAKQFGLGRKRGRPKQPLTVDEDSIDPWDAWEKHMELDQKWNQRVTQIWRESVKHRTTRDKAAYLDGVRLSFAEAE